MSNQYNIQNDTFIGRPQLHLDHSMKFWMMSVSVDVCGDDRQYQLQIRHYWNGETWNKYEFFQVDYSIGDPVQLLSAEEMQAGYDAVQMNEGATIANHWYNEPCRKLMTGFEPKLKAAMIRRWEAICELVSPSITI